MEVRSVRHRFHRSSEVSRKLSGNVTFEERYHPVLFLCQHGNVPLEFRPSVSVQRTPIEPGMQPIFQAPNIQKL